MSSWFRGNKQPNPPAARPVAGAPAGSPNASSSAPPAAGFGVVANTGFVPATLPLQPNITQRPTPQALAQAHKARSAGLAGAVFGGPPAPLAQSTVQPHAGHLSPQQQQYGGQTFVQPPTPTQQYQHNAGIPGGPPGAMAPPPTSSGGDMFDMFGGLDVKAADAAAAASTATTDAEEPSSFSFLSEDSSADTSNGIADTTPVYDPAAAYSVPVPTPATNDNDRLHSTMSYLDRCLSIFWQEWRSLIASQSQLKQEEVQLQLAIRRDTAAVKETEEKQAAAVMAEEYEKADTYNAEMERLQQAIRTAQDRLVRTRQEVEQREQHKSGSIQKILSILTDTNHQFETLNNTKQQELTIFIQTQITALTTKDRQIENDYDRVNQSLSHTQKDLDHLTYEDDNITRSLTQETQPFIDEKNHLVSDESRLQKELEDLKRAVIMKEKEIVDNRDKQHNAERAVDLIRIKYQQQRSSVQDKRHQIDILRNKDVQEKRDIEYRQKMLQEDINKHKKLEHDYRSYLHEIAKTTAHIHYLTHLITTDNEHRTQYHNTYQQDQQTIAKLTYELSNYESNLATIRQELVSVEQAVENHRNNINNITQKIPSMEAEKNTAVTARDFKKAAAASKEIKTLQQSKADSEAAIEELQKQVEKHKDTLATADQKKIQIQQDIIRLEDVSDRKRLHYLLLNERSLIQRQAHTTKSLQQAYDSNSSATPIHPPLLDHLQKEVESLDMELKWVQVEIKELRNKHGWSESIGKLDQGEEWQEIEESQVINHINDPSPFDNIKQPKDNINSNLSGIQQNGQILGIPTINAPIAKSASSSSSSSSLSSLSSSTAASKKKPTIEDLNALRSQLSSAQSQLSGYEKKSADSIDAGEYEAAAELEDKIAQEKDKVSKLQQQIAAMQKELPEEISSPKIEKPNSPAVSEEDPFAEEA